MIISTLLTTMIIFPNSIQPAEHKYWYICDEEIYCGGVGNMLGIIQGARIYPDSKTYVDMVQINRREVTSENFNNTLKATKNNPTKMDIIKFIEKNFRIEPEWDRWTPPDFNESPAFLGRILNHNIKIFAKKIVKFWPELGRILKSSVKEHPKRHSMVWIPNGFIIPGGRFREMAYWDSYFIIQGLLVCEMTETVKGILDNFVQLILTEPSNSIPRGNRIYWRYISSQPVFPAMVSLYIEETNDIEWLKRNVDAIELNFKFWQMDDKTVTVNNNLRQYKLGRFGSVLNFPRSEQWMEDLTTCAIYETNMTKSLCYSAMKAGSESGWDFSTRWLYDQTGGINTSLSYGDIKRTVPVDLNAILCQGAALLSDFYNKVGNKVKKEEYAKMLQQKIKFMEEIFYNSTDGIWYDYDSVKSQHRRFFFPSNFAPLWAGCVDPRKMEYYGRRAAEYIYSQGVDTYTGGIPTSLHQDSDENWDYPNAMPPLQELVVTALYNSGNLEAKKLAKKFAIRYIVASTKAWISTDGGLYDKFSAIDPGMPGRGGHNPVQIGYGWSLGVALSFIDRFACSAGILKVILNSLFCTTVFSLIPYLENCYVTK